MIVEWGDWWASYPPDNTSQTLSSPPCRHCWCPSSWRCCQTSAAPSPCSCRWPPAPVPSLHRLSEQFLTSPPAQSSRYHQRHTFWRRYEGKIVMLLYQGKLFASFDLKIVDDSFSKPYLKAQFSFCSGDPAEVTSIARRNSLKSMNPLLSLSNVLKTWEQKSSAFPANHQLMVNISTELSKQHETR